MDKRLHVPLRGGLALLADKVTLTCVMPIFTKEGESPQLTHFWNNLHLDRAETAHLDRRLMVHCEGDPGATPRRGWWDIRFHLGWWLKFTVLEPTMFGDYWHVGWIGKERAGISQIPMYGGVRMLTGPDDVSFFGVRQSDHRQIKIREAGRGRIGDHGPFARVPLL